MCAFVFSTLCFGKTATLSIVTVPGLVGAAAQGPTRRPSRPTSIIVTMLGLVGGADPILA